MTLTCRLLRWDTFELPIFADYNRNNKGSLLTSCLAVTEKTALSPKQPV